MAGSSGVSIEVVSGVRVRLEPERAGLLVIEKDMGDKVELIHLDLDGAVELLSCVRTASSINGREISFRITCEHGHIGFLTMKQVNRILADLVQETARLREEANLKATQQIEWVQDMREGRGF